MSIELLTGVSTYLLIILCELGDKTQMAVLLLTSRNPQKRWLVFLASSLALSLCVLLEVTVGVKLAQYLTPHIINKLAGIIFLLMGILGLWNEFFNRTEINVSGNQSFVYEEANRS